LLSPPSRKLSPNPSKSLAAHANSQAKSELTSPSSLKPTSAPSATTLKPLNQKKLKPDPMFSSLKPAKLSAVPAMLELTNQLPPPSEAEHSKSMDPSESRNQSNSPKKVMVLRNQEATHKKLAHASKTGTKVKSPLPVAIALPSADHEPYCDIQSL
jgi:hypothetical protein